MWLRVTLKWLNDNIKNKLPESINKNIVEPLKKWYCNTTKQH